MTEITIPSDCALFDRKVAITDTDTGSCVDVVDGSMQVSLLNQLVPEQYDEITLGYTGDNLTTVTYELDSVTVATLTLTYTGDNLTNVSKS